jgi:uncharacterized protein
LGLEWTWDKNKAEANLKKHNVSFELAALVFNDPFQLNELDPYLDEERWRTLGRPFPDHPQLLLSL